MSGAAQQPESAEDFAGVVLELSDQALPMACITERVIARDRAVAAAALERAAEDTRDEAHHAVSDCQDAVADVLYARCRWLRTRAARLRDGVKGGVA